MTEEAVRGRKDRTLCSARCSLELSANPGLVEPFGPWSLAAMAPARPTAMSHRMSRHVPSHVPPCPAMSPIHVPLPCPAAISRCNVPFSGPRFFCFPDPIGLDRSHHICEAPSLCQGHILSMSHRLSEMRNWGDASVLNINDRRCRSRDNLKKLAWARY
ncbi:hypothetical protein B0H67DRAFT_259746 [Lasiosphaeris hirsuta]|uniref:Uncharacterized protein n=1 Tax=Lasiosphaeris hirsuta TaxID=260670 RepID=A0AA40AI14_9PEZI|nr:hypothetical protein B0H67DRAFT_259746 [Lasiosphaeris hirsuta]